VVRAAPFVAIEGPKGVGKTSLCAVLSTRLDPLDQALLTKEPTSAFDLRKEQALRGVALAAAIAADRRMHVAEEIGPALAAGRPVVCDRYILSSYVFHTADGVPEMVVADLNRSFPLPSLNLILRTDAEVIGRRLGQRGQVTRLQAADSAGEFAEYLHYATRMASFGTPYEVWNNADPEARQVIVDRLLALVRMDDWNP
jgi:dTMP kinase